MYDVSLFSVFNSWVILFHLSSLRLPEQPQLWLLLTTEANIFGGGYKSWFIDLCKLTGHEIYETEALNSAHLHEFISNAQKNTWRWLCPQWKSMIFIAAIA